MAWLRRLLFLLLLPIAAYGQGMRYDNFVIKPMNTGGLISVSGALITVCTSAGTGTPCTPKVANIYSDEALTTPITGTGGAGTTNSDSGGNFGFYAAPGSYIVTVTGSGITSYTIKVVLPLVGGSTNTFTGINTFQNIIQLSGGTCSAAGIIASLAAVAVGGTVDARACTTAFTWSSLVTISSPVTLWLPCANVTFTTQLLNITADDVHIHGCGAGGSGAISIYNSPTAGSVYTASGLGAGVNAIVAYKGAQGTLQAQRQSAFTLDNLIINMNGVGNRAISTSSCWSCKIDQVIIQNANCSDGAFFQEASNPAGLLLTESYFMHMDNVLVTIAQANTTCHPFMFDASRGEIAYATYTNLTAIGYPQAAGSGSDSVYVNTGGTAINQSFDQNVFINLKTQDPTTGAFGIKLQARGNFGGTLASSFIRTNGSIFNVQFVDAQPERIFSTGGSGTGIGCINAAGAADGTGCAFLSNSNFSSGGWANNEDSLNMGAGYMSVGSNSAVLQGPIFRQTGLHNGSNSNFERIDPTYQPTANSQTGFSVFVVPSTINPNNFTGAILHGIQVDLADGTHTGGNFANAYGFYCNGFGSWATGEWCFYGVGASGNHSDSWWEIGGASVANPGGLANTGRVWYDQTNQRMSLSNNNGAFSFLPTIATQNTWAAIQSHPANTAALTADWTCGTAGTVSSCVAATIIGSGGGVPLTFTLPSVAQSYTLECDGVVGQATAVTANQWNLLTATNGATNVTANYTMATAATAFAAGAVTDQASTTTTFQIAPSWTLGAIGTKMPFHIYAKIEGASASGTVVSLQLVAPTVADLVTIYRGASCRIF